MRGRTSIACGIGVAAITLSLGAPVSAQSDAGVPSPPPAAATDGGSGSGSGSGSDAGSASGSPADAGPGADAAGVIVNSTLPPGVEEPRATANPSSAEVPIGKRFSLFVAVTYSKGMEVNLPASLQLGGAFEEMRRTNTKTTNALGEPVREFEIELMAWVVGDMRIPSIPVTYAYNGSVHQIQTPPVAIRVITMIGDGKEQLRDIVPPVSVTRKNYLVLYMLAGLGMAVGCVLFGLQARRVFRRRRKRRRRVVEAAIAARPLGPAEEAFAALATLEESEAFSAEDREPLYVELSVIVRRYLGRRFAFRALDLTTAEVKRRLGNLPEGAQVTALLGDLLDRADLVKYANYGASGDDAQIALTEARNLVEQTRYQMQAPPPLIPLEAAATLPNEDTAASTLVGMGAVTDTIIDDDAAIDETGGADVS